MAASEMASHWDRVANDYSAHVSRFTTLHAADLLSAVSSQIAAAETVLDIACGAGAFALAYLNAFPHGIAGQTLILSDFSPAMVAVAERRVNALLPEPFLTRLQFRVEDATNMHSVPDNTVDLAVSIFGVFLIHPKQSALKEIVRVLRPGATFGTTAWTHLPEPNRLETAGFGAEFQSSVAAAFEKLSKPDPHAPAPWKAWMDPTTVKKELSEASFQTIQLYRSIHTTTFDNFDNLWNTVTKTCPFADMATADPNKLNQIKTSLMHDVAVEKDTDPVFVVMASNVIVAGGAA